MKLSIFEYKEEVGGTFSSDGIDYDINKIFDLVENLPIIYVNVNDLKWILEYDDPDISSRDDIDIEIPIIITYVDENKFLVVDGVHRLKKCILDKKKYIKSKFLENSKMEETII